MGSREWKKSWLGGAWGFGIQVCKELLILLLVKLQQMLEPPVEPEEPREQEMMVLGGGSFSMKDRASFQKLIVHSNAVSI